MAGGKSNKSRKQQQQQQQSAAQVQHPQQTGASSVAGSPTQQPSTAAALQPTTSVTTTKAVSGTTTGAGVASAAANASGVAGRPPQSTFASVATATAQTSGIAATVPVDSGVSVANSTKETPGSIDTIASPVVAVAGASGGFSSANTTEAPATADTNASSMSAEPLTGEALQKARREFVFASMVGHRILVDVKDGATVSGIFTIYGNAELLPETWRGVSNWPAPTADSLYLYVTARPPSTTPQPSSSQGPGSIAAEDDDDDGGWRVVASKPRKGKAATTKAVSTPKVSDDNVSTSGNGNVFASPSPMAGGSCLAYGGEDRLTFPLFHGESLNPTQPKGPFMWLRCAYRCAGDVLRSSRVHDYIAVPWDQIAAVTAKDVANQPDRITQTAHKSGFMTDAEISGQHRVTTEGRQLQRWSGDDIDGSADTEWPDTLKDDATFGGPTGGVAWDQFQLNEVRFGVKSTYVEGMYSTALDEKAIPAEYRQHAERLAEEMEATLLSRKQHRNKIGGSYNSDGSDDDEEAKFSAVTGAGRYATDKPPRTSRYEARGSAYLDPIRNRVPPDRYDRNSEFPILKRPGNQQGGIPIGTSSNKELYPFDFGPRSVSNATATAAAAAAPIGPPQVADMAGLASGTTSVSHHQQQQQQRPQQPAPAAAEDTTVTGASGGAEGAKTAANTLKDNINALNLEPTKKTKVPLLPPVQPLPRVRPPVELRQAAAAAARSAAPPGDIQERKKMKKLEFLEALKQIQLNLERKGWAKGPARSLVSVADSATARRIEGNVVAGTAATAGGKPGAAIETHGVATAANIGTAGNAAGGAAAAVQHGVSTEVDDGLSLAKRMFQFNPHASSFTPKGSADFQEQRTGPRPADRSDTTTAAAKPTCSQSRGAQHDTTHPAGGAGTAGDEADRRVAPAAKRHAPVFTPFDPAMTELRRHALRTMDTVSTNDDSTTGGDQGGAAPHFFDYFLECARAHAFSRPLTELNPDWENKINTSYTDFTTTGGVFGATATAVAATTPQQPALFMANLLPTFVPASHMPGVAGHPGLVPAGAAATPLLRGMQQVPSGVQGAVPANAAAGTATAAGMHAGQPGAPLQMPIPSQLQPGIVASVAGPNLQSGGIPQQQPQLGAQPPAGTGGLPAHPQPTQLMSSGLVPQPMTAAAGIPVSVMASASAAVGGVAASGTAATVAGSLSQQQPPQLAGSQHTPQQPILGHPGTAAVMAAGQPQGGGAALPQAAAQQHPQQQQAASSQQQQQTPMQSMSMAAAGTLPQTRGTGPGLQQQQPGIPPQQPPHTSQMPPVQQQMPQQLGSASSGQQTATPATPLPQHPLHPGQAPPPNAAAGGLVSSSVNPQQQQSGSFNGQAGSVSIAPATPANVMLSHPGGGGQQQQQGQQMVMSAADQQAVIQQQAAAAAAIAMQQQHPVAAMQLAPGQAFYGQIGTPLMPGMQPIPAQFAPQQFGTQPFLPLMRPMFPGAPAAAQTLDPQTAAAAGVVPAPYPGLIIQPGALPAGQRWAPIATGDPNQPWIMPNYLPAEYQYGMVMQPQRMPFRMQ